MKERTNRTYFMKGEEIWTSDKKMEQQMQQQALPDSNFLNAMYSFYSVNDIRDMLKLKLSGRIIKEESYVSKEEFDEFRTQLTQQLSQIKKKLEVLCPPTNVLPITIVDEISENLMCIKGISGVFYQLDNNALTVYLVVSSLPENLLNEISKAEIAFSRKHPELSVEFEPVFEQEEIEGESIPIWDS